ncbi:MAG: hypothetical protein ACFBSG_19755 [Leptolyngbyaceae cyanobacterium]
MTKQFSKMLRSLPQWLTQQWSTTAAAVDDDDHLAPLPAGLTQSLNQHIASLPTPERYQKALQLSVREAIQAWQANPEVTSNCLVALSTPIEAIASHIKASLEDYLLDCHVRFLLSGYHRSDDPIAITNHLQRELARATSPENDHAAVPMTEAELHETISTIMVVPNLDECFLRCIEGWEGIEHLQRLVSRDTARFWVFGSNDWAWIFLDKVCQVSAYLDQTVALPELKGEDIATWLQPLFDLEIEQPDGTPLQLHITSEKETYWETLTALAKGNATTAASLWLRTLRIDAKDLTPEGALPAEVHTINLVAAQPTLPHLMSLENLDRYLLHELLVHGEMTQAHLAYALGEDERVVRSRAQVLHREGIVIQRGRRLRVHPAHYPKIYRELGNNNFLIG